MNPPTVQETACNSGDLGLIPGLGRSPGEGNGNPLQCSVGNPMDRGAWGATVYGVARVGHNLATIPPPSSCLATCQISPHRQPLLCITVSAYTSYWPHVISMQTLQPHCKSMR